jgi:outer membrane protein assembly factor BamE (lipoprotein component of BamABCDE complex)
MDRSRVRIAAAALLAAAGAAACTPVQTHSGFRSDYNNAEIPDPQVGVDTRDTILARFGSPSTTAIFDQTAWYYISATQERFAFYTPRVTERKVLVVRFDANNTVSAVDHYGLDRGRVIAYNSEVTPTRGRELGIVEQIFGNIGSTPPIRTEDNEGGRRER